jgi:hypothetical protein
MHLYPPTCHFSNLEKKEKTHVREMEREKIDYWTGTSERLVRSIRSRSSKMKRPTTPRRQQQQPQQNTVPTSTTKPGTVGRGPPPPVSSVQMDSGGGSRGGEATATAQVQDNKGKEKQKLVVNYTGHAGSKREGGAGSVGGVSGVTVRDCELERLEYSGGAVVGWAAVVIIVAAVAAWATFVAAYGAQASERERGCQTGLILALSEVARCREGMLTTDNYTRAEASPSPQTTAPPSLSPLPPADSAQHQKAAPLLPAFFVSEDRSDQDFRPRWTGALGTNI